MDTLVEPASYEILHTALCDLIRIAFTAATSLMPELALAGLHFLKEVLHIYSNLVDPLFPESHILEQYQAQITSALTPAFSSESVPKVTAEALNICADYIACGIVKDTDQMIRIICFLISGLDAVQKKINSDFFRIDEFTVSTTVAEDMLHIAVLSAWATLQVESKNKKYIKELLDAFINTLIPLWVSTLKYFTHLQIDPDDKVLKNYGNNSQQFILNYYFLVQPRIISAVSTIISQDINRVFSALQTESISIATQVATSHFKGNTSLFFVLFGLCVESLIEFSKTYSSVNSQCCEILDSLLMILQPSIYEISPYKISIFSEFIELLDRIVLMKGDKERSLVIAITERLRNLLVDQSSQFRVDGSMDVEQIFDLTLLDDCTAHRPWTQIDFFM